MVIQVLITLCSLFVLSRAFKKYQKKEIRFSLFALWSFFWVLIILFVWQPQQTDRLAALLQVGRGADAVFYISLIFIFYLFFKVFLVLEKIEQQITTLVREIAIIKKDSSKQ